MRNYFDALGLEANTLKSQVMVINPPPEPPDQLSIPWTWGEHELPVVQEFKYLGVILTAKGDICAMMPNLQHKTRGAFKGVRRHLKELDIASSVKLLLQLLSSSVTPVLLFASQVWGPRSTAAQTHKHARVYEEMLSAVAGVCSKSSGKVVVAALGEKPFEEMVWKLVAGFWNQVAGMEDADLYKRVLAQDIRDAQGGVKNWSYGVLAHFRALRLPAPVLDGTPQLIEVAPFLKRMEALWLGQFSATAICPRTCVSDVAVCRFARCMPPPGTPVSSYFHDLPLRYGDVKRILGFLIGDSKLPVDVGARCRPAVPRSQRYCTRCSLGVVGDAKHLLLECPGMVVHKQTFAQLFPGGPMPLTIRAFLWQADRMGVSKYVLPCFKSLDSEVACFNG